MSYLFPHMHVNQLYPIFLNLAGRRCLVAGLGSTGSRKLRGLLTAGADNILALDLRPVAQLTPSARQLLVAPGTVFRQGQCNEVDIRQSFLVFACTGSPAENRRIAALCGGAGVLCNSVTEPQAGSFILPAVARAGSLCAALSTSGQSPHLAKLWRQELQEWLVPKEHLTWLMGRLRPLVQSLNLSQAQNAAIFARITASPIPAWLENPATVDKCHEWLKNELPCCAPQLDQIFSEYSHVFA